MEMCSFIDFGYILRAKLAFSVEIPLPQRGNCQMSLRRNPDFAQKSRFSFRPWMEIIAKNGLCYR